MSRSGGSISTIRRPVHPGCFCIFYCLALLRYPWSVASAVPFCSGLQFSAVKFARRDLTPQSTALRISRDCCRTYFGAGICRLARHDTNAGSRLYVLAGEGRNIILFVVTIAGDHSK